MCRMTLVQFVSRRWAIHFPRHWSQLAKIAIRLRKLYLNAVGQLINKIHRSFRANYFALFSAPDYLLIRRFEECWFAHILTNECWFHWWFSKLLKSLWFHFRIWMEICSGHDSLLSINVYQSAKFVPKRKRAFICRNQKKSTHAKGARWNRHRRAKNGSWIPLKNCSFKSMIDKGSWFSLWFQSGPS